ncbi:MAG: carbon-nitrogen hydrolase family protein [Gammaproteobacteria bacterium]
MGANIKVAAVQAAPVFLDLDGAVDKAIALIEEAARNGARLIGFPETWIPGYPFWIWINCPAESLDLVRQYHENSLSADSPQLQKLCNTAKENNIMVVMGASERIGGSLYLSQFFIESDGSLIDVRQKLKPTHVERTIFGDGYGHNLNVYDTSVGRVGGLCCWEHLQPLSKYALYSQNEQIHVGAWPSFSLYKGKAYSLGPEMNMAVSSVYAAEGQSFFIAPCGVISDEIVELIADTSGKKDLLPAGGGHAMIFGPDGAAMCEPLDEKAEGLLYAELDFSAITIAKSFADPTGHYSRPDVTRLLLNTSPVTPVELYSNPPPQSVSGDDTGTEAEVESAVP